ncbi:MAG: anti-sigma factor [Syntrophobacteraceae bacterium]
MDCNKFLSRLNAYVDGELTDMHRQEMDTHFSVCPACRERLEELGSLGERLDFLEVPALPSGFASRVTALARDRQVLSAPENRRFRRLNRQPLRWVGELSILMRAAVASVVVLAFLLGFLMSKELTSTSRQKTLAAASESMEGFEWFGSTPPESIGSAYLTLALAPTEELEAK